MWNVLNGEGGDEGVGGGRYGGSAMTLLRQQVSRYPFAVKRTVLDRERGFDGSGIFQCAQEIVRQY
jgi:hypothetical protein